MGEESFLMEALPMGESLVAAADQINALKERRNV